VNAAGRLRAPSGAQIELTHGDQRAVIVEVGGGLREYAADGEAVLDGYAEHERCRSGRGQILAPWPNRLKDGSYEWAGERQQLALSDVAAGNAIHGLVRWANWTPLERAPSRLAMGCVLHPQDGYPFALALRVAYTLDAGGLTVETTARNIGGEACPYGAGAHPYLTVGAERIDDCILSSPGASRLLADERQIPTGSAPVQGTDYDFRRPRTIGESKLDTCYGDLSRDGDGRARVTLTAPASASASDRKVTLWLDEQHRYLMLFTGDTLADESRRRCGLAVEPMTCAPNAFRSGEGLRTLQPGESLASAWGIEPG
jgi:aldose 1-epimerase